MAVMESTAPSGTRLPSARDAVRGRRWDDARRESPERMYAAFLAEGRTADEALRFLVALLAWPIGADAGLLLRLEHGEATVLAEAMEQVPAWSDPALRDAAREAAAEAARRLGHDRFTLSEGDEPLPAWCAWALGAPGPDAAVLLLFVTTSPDAAVVRARADRVVDLLAVAVAGRHPLPGGARLSTRQLSVLRHLAEDLTMRQIASRIGFSESTVRMESLAIYRVLGVHDRHEAVSVGITTGLIAATR